MELFTSNWQIKEFSNTSEYRDKDKDKDEDKVEDKDEDEDEDEDEEEVVYHFDAP